MSSNNLPDPPNQLKAIQSFMKVASDIERVDPVVSYWVRLYSTETALNVDKDSPECKSFLSSIIVWLEKFKQSHKDNEAISNQTVGQAHMENFVVALFTKADTLDRDGTANKNTVKMFYMAAILFEAMAVFGSLSEDITKKAKYAKFKAAYIQKCLKLGQVPKPGPIEGSDLEDPTFNQESTDNDQNKPRDETVIKTIDPKPDPFIMTPTSKPTFPQQPQPPVLPTDTPLNLYPASTNTAREADSSSGSSSNRVTSTIDATKFHATNGVALNAEDLIKGQRYCKFANSALQYDDIPTAVANLEKALKLLTTGQHSD